MTDTTFAIDPKLDLVLERRVEASAKLVWAAWTTPEHVSKWFAPAPWTISNCRIDLRPGGAFGFIMHGPDGEKMDSVGCYLEVVPGRRLVWTDALGPGFRPSAEPFFTARVSIEPDGRGARYQAVAIRADETAREKHEQMGFHAGWGTVFDQLAAFVGQM